MKFRRTAFALLLLLAGCARRPSIPPPPAASEGAAVASFRAATASAAAVRQTFASKRAHFLAPGAVAFSVDFKDRPSRVTWDLPVTADLSQCRGVAFDFYCTDLSQFRAFNGYFKSGAGWYRATLSPEREGAWEHLRVTRDACRAEGQVAGWNKVTALRVAGWRAGAGRTTCAFANFACTVGEAKPSPTEKKTTEAARTAWLKARPSKKGEWRACWCHAARGFRGRDWEGTIRFLKENGFNAVMPNLAWAGTAFYRSSVLNVHPSVATRGDAFEQCLAACRKYGVECHVWKVCWNMGACVSPDFERRMVAANRVQVNAQGEKLTRWLCPSHPENRRLEIAAMMELARKGPDGIHFDYIRYPDGNHCFCAGCRRRFEARLGKSVDNWPAAVCGADATTEMKRAWRAFRTDNITAVVRAVAEDVHRTCPKVKVSAATYRNAETDPAEIGQDWGAWCRSGYLDFVCPMDYESSPALFRGLVTLQKESVGHAKFYPGIGLSCFPSEGGEAVRLAKEIEAVRKLGLDGFAVFGLDRTAERALPQLRLGVTRTN